MKKSDALKQAQQEHLEALTKREDFKSESQECRRGAYEHKLALANNIVKAFDKESGVITTSIIDADLVYRIIDLEEKADGFMKQAADVQLPPDVTPQEINKAMDEEEAEARVQARKTKIKKGVK